MSRREYKSVSGWQNPPWHPTAHLSLCGTEACDDPVYDETDPGVCQRCGIVRAEHESGRLAVVKEGSGER